MTFQQLRYLLEVYKTGSIAKAAANLFVTRPGVSLCINALESELGYPIFVRTPKGLQPTPRGEQALEYAARIFDNYRLMTDIEQPIHRRIRIATVHYEPVHNTVCRLLAEYHDDPCVSFSFPHHALPSAIKKLSVRELDAALVTTFNRNGHPSFEQLESKPLQWTLLCQIPMMICIGPGHHLYHKETLTPADFNGDILIDTPSLAFSRLPWIQEYVQFDPNRSVSSDSFPTQILYSGAGFSIRRIPDSKLQQAYRLRCIPIPGLMQDLLAITDPGYPLAPEAKRFLEILDEELPLYTKDL